MDTEEVKKCPRAQRGEATHQRGIYAVWYNRRVILTQASSRHVRGQFQPCVRVQLYDKFRPGGTDGARIRPVKDLQV